MTSLVKLYNITSLKKNKYEAKLLLLIERITSLFYRHKINDTKLIYLSTNEKKMKEKPNQLFIFKILSNIFEALRSIKEILKKCYKFLLLNTLSKFKEKMK